MLCEVDCGAHGTADGSHCVCESTRYGGQRCEVDCGQHGSGRPDGTCDCDNGVVGLRCDGCAGGFCGKDCDGTGPGSTYGCAPTSPDFPGSRLLTAEWGGTLSGWAGKGEGQEWSLCCSTFEGCDTAAKFHAACDAHTPTLTVAHHAGEGGSNFTFGGFVRPSLPAFVAVIFCTLLDFSVSLPSK